MGLWARTGRFWRAVLLLAVGLAGGAAAVAVATVPDSGGVIHACYDVNGSGEPASGATLTVIDPSAGQTCAAATVGASPGQRELSWNQQGPAGTPGAPGQQGPQGPPGNTTTVTKGGTLTLSGGQVLQVESAGGGVTLPTPIRPLPGGSNVVMGSGASALSFPILDVSLLGSGGSTGTGKAAVKDITITKQVDKASPKLFQACATGKHFPTALLTVRKAGGKTYLRYYFRQVFVTAIQSAGSPRDKAIPTEQVTFTYGSLQVQYVKQNS
jgi:Type VI secretion system effector, Hcp